jgi:hypothetical protein
LCRSIYRVLIGGEGQMGEVKGNIPKRQDVWAHQRQGKPRNAGQRSTPSQGSWEGQRSNEGPSTSETCRPTERLVEPTI